ncbi:hypothetical protein CCR75_008370 [Bremia lactucae]|uniref:Fido domain-containing protein n=1 Tax=Bremia lactucae TaxID=4779 RepID=A0A976FGJ0_BRELC|nr:hypothetical protein CCR75_008370 [Bremia lactucae]
MNFTGTAMHSTAMCWAAAEGNLAAIRRLREDYDADVNAADYDKRTPLHIAVSDEQLEMVAYLLQCGANVDALDRWGRSPIDCAMETTNAALLRLLDRKTYNQSDTQSRVLKDKSKRTRQSKPNVTSLFQVIQEGNTEKVKRLWLSGMEVNVTDALGRTSLHVAVETKQVNMIELLLSAGVKTNVVDSFGRSPMSIAMENNHVLIAEMLRAYQVTATASRVETSHATPSQIAMAFQATKRGEVETLKQFVPAFVPVDVQDYDHRTLLHVASAEGQWFLVKYLIECGANVNVMDRWGSSPLSDAIDFAHNDVANLLIANQANESGSRVTIAVDSIDSATLAKALEYTLRVLTRGPWVMGQVYCPVRNDATNCVLMTHSIWHKNSLLLLQQTPTHLNEGPRVASMEAIQKYRKVSSVVMIDPGQGHIGSVYSGQSPEWLHLHGVQQSQFFLLPHARVAGIQTSVSVPMIWKLSTVAVLSWYSYQAMEEDIHVVQRMQRVLRSVTILATLRQEVVESSRGSTKCIPRFQYCQSLENAITANGELTDSFLSRDDLEGCDTLPLALEWGLFDLVDTLATSMSSEDHAAVIPILRALVLLLRNGFFQEAVIESRCKDSVSIKDVIEECGGNIRTKKALLGHVEYYLEYLYTVSPTEGHVFTDIQELSMEVDTLLRNPAKGKIDDTSATFNQEDHVKLDAGAAFRDQTSSFDCVLCQYNVAGHIHPGRDPIPATPLITTSFQSKNEGPLCTQVEKPHSPVYRTIQQLLTTFQSEYDAFERKTELGECCDRTKPAIFTSSDLYDVIGSTHEFPKTRSTPSSDQTWTHLLEIVHEIIEDSTCILSRNQLFALHECLVPTSSGHAGKLRTELAVGFASPRIYRVFMPAHELERALNQYIETLNDTCQWEQRPLLCAYYSFAVLVFYIHPFYDGNGRCARLIGNLIAKKLGFPSVLRATDKTMQVPEFLQKVLATMEILRNSRRQLRQSRLRSSRRENLSIPLAKFAFVFETSAAFAQEVLNLFFCQLPQLGAQHVKEVYKQIVRVQDLQFEYPSAAILYYARYHTIPVFEQYSALWGFAALLRAQMHETEPTNVKANHTRDCD